MLDIMYCKIYNGYMNTLQYNKEEKMETQKAGIDYGMGLSNIDKDTGIRYGVISIYEVTQTWADSSEPEYGDMECSNCGDPVTANDTVCPNCGTDMEGYFEFDMEPLYYNFQDKEYTATQTADDTDIFIIKSPYYTLCSLCSPCAPGAGYIMDQNENGVKAYCFGHDWFDDGKAPYKVFDVKTDKEV